MPLLQNGVGYSEIVFSPLALLSHRLTETETTIATQEDAAKSLVEKNGEEISTLTESNEMKDKRIAELEAEVERLNTKLKEDEVKMLLVQIVMIIIKVFVSN